MDVIHYSQGDPQWGALMLGRDNTIKQAGCAITSVAMLFAHFSGKPITPKSVDEFLDRNQGYQGDLLLWTALLNYASAFGLDWDDVQSEPWQFGKPLQMREGTLPICRVETDRGTTHFVLLLDPATGEINDPGTKMGKSTTLKYQNYTPNRITWIYNKAKFGAKKVDNSSVIMAVQTFCQLLGFDPGPRDGLAGPKTRTAFTQAKKKADEALT